MEVQEKIEGFKEALNEDKKYKDAWHSLPKNRKELFLRTIILNPYIPVIPFYKQFLFLTSTEREVFYGGQAGGGKSEALLMAALQYVEAEDYAAIIFRRKFTDLSLAGALISRSHEWLSDTDARWNSNTKTWTFPSGATLGFGYMQTERDKYKYQSAEFQCICFDELTQFRLEEYLYLFSRLRKVRGSPIPMRMLSASNPGNIGHQWVKDRFIRYQGPDRRYIPSGIDDNIHLDGDLYREALSNLDVVERRRLLHGDWDISYSGGLFQDDWIRSSLIPPESAEDLRGGLLNVCRFWDLAGTEGAGDWTVGALMGSHEDGRFYLLDVVRFRGSPMQVEDALRRVTAMDIEVYPDYIVCLEAENNASAKITQDHIRRNVLPMVNVEFVRPPQGEGKLGRAKPFASWLEQGRVKIVNDAWVDDLREEFIMFPDGDHDDQVDAVVGAFNRLYGSVKSAFVKSVPFF